MGYAATGSTAQLPAACAMPCHAMGVLRAHVVPAAHHCLCSAGGAFRGIPCFFTFRPACLTGDGGFGDADFGYVMANPVGIAVNPSTARIYVADMRYRRVQAGHASDDHSGPGAGEETALRWLGRYADLSIQPPHTHCDISPMCRPLPLVSVRRCSTWMARSNSGSLSMTLITVTPQEMYKGFAWMVLPMCKQQGKF